jgi:hypothetical protein
MTDRNLRFVSSFQVRCPAVKAKVKKESRAVYSEGDGGRKSFGLIGTRPIEFLCPGTGSCGL